MSSRVSRAAPARAAHLHPVGGHGYCEEHKQAGHEPHNIRARVVVRRHVPDGERQGEQAHERCEQHPDEVERVVGDRCCRHGASGVLLLKLSLKEQGRPGHRETSALSGLRTLGSMAGEDGSLRTVRCVRVARSRLARGAARRENPSSGPRSTRHRAPAATLAAIETLLPRPQFPLGFLSPLRSTLAAAPRSITSGCW